MSELDQPPYADEGATPGPLEHLDGEDGAAVAADPVADQPAAAPSSRRTGRTVVAATLAVLLVLVAGGAAYGWSVLQRPDVQLARAFDTTRSAAQGSMTVTVEGPGPASTLSSSSVRYSWAPGTQQLTVTSAGTKVGTVTTTDTHLTVQVDPSSLPAGTLPTDPLAGLGAPGALGALSGAGDVVSAFLDGRPVGIAIGPGSALQKALDKAEQSAGSSSAAPASPGEIAQILDAVTQAVKQSATVTEEGTDTRGTHYVVTLPLATVVDVAWTRIKAVLPAEAAGLAPDIPRLADATLTADVWVHDGSITRIEVRVGKGLGDVVPGASGSRLVVTMGPDGVHPVVGPVTEVPESLIELLTGNG